MLLNFVVWAAPFCCNRGSDGDGRLGCTRIGRALESAVGTFCPSFEDSFSLRNTGINVEYVNWHIITVSIWKCKWKDANANLEMQLF